ncbi:hypothetical protein NDU88_002090 [Pleurodeles waltl]|uniref:Uncharacterized protein n=1 Tax=Pleurodeles waltl TaxID=8319 RepID=A0AAV7U9H2_PLEWA|nr:hypothetical protein NDU88_002090 [Pleurodeles waltl]
MYGSLTDEPEHASTSSSPTCGPLSRLTTKHHIRAQMFDFFCEYETSRVVVVQNKMLGISFRIFQLVIIAYFVGRPCPPATGMFKERSDTEACNMAATPQRIQAEHSDFGLGFNERGRSSTSSSPPKRPRIRMHPCSPGIVIVIQAITSFALSHMFLFQNPFNCTFMSL